MTVLESPAPEHPRSGAGQAAAGSTTSTLVSSPLPSIVGVDLSLAATGLATRHGAWMVETAGHRADPWHVRGHRIGRVRAAVLDATRAADLVVVEGPAYSKNDPGAFDRAGLWWVLYRAWQARGIRVVVVTTGGRARYATGNGRANKDQVLAAVVRRFPAFDVTDNNAADALVLVAMACDHYGTPLADMPAKHRAALAAVVWPEIEKAG